MNKRRNPFETSEPASSVTAAPSIYDALRVAAPREANRQWEKQHQSHKAVYRGVEPKLALKVKSIAAELLVPEGEVAWALIQYALRAYGLGDLNLNPRPNPYRMRMTLFPSSEVFRNYDHESKPKRRKQTIALWRVIVTWRNFSPDLKEELAALASDAGLNVPLGELINALLRYGLTAYQSDLLKLEPVQKAISNTLVLADRK